MIEKKDEPSSPAGNNADLTNPAATLAQSHHLLQLTICEVSSLSL
jgi:hypothetical protein